MTATVMHVNRMFRDDEVSDHVGAISKLRGFEVEFEVYGIAYWENGRRQYLASGNAETLHEQFSLLKCTGCYPILPQIWSERRFVPAGWDSEVEQQVKFNCCKRLQGQFPVRLWEQAIDVAEGKFDDSAIGILEPMRDQLEGVFNADYLQMFEALTNRLYCRHNLTPQSYNRFISWLEEERDNMVDVIGERDIFCKDMYGFAYRGEGLPVQIVMDSVRKIVDGRLQEIVQKGGVTVTPIFHNKCWYSRDYRLLDMRHDFKNRLQFLFDEGYFALLEAADGLPVIVDQVAYLRERERLQIEGNERLLKTWECFGRQWGIN